MKRALSLLLLLFIVTCTVSAKVITAITLKNGSIFEGVKIEENNQIVRLEFANRDIRIFYKSDIASISTSEQTQAERRELQRLHGRGYHQFVNLSYSYCSVTDFLGVSYIGGYRFNPYIFLGVGAGLNFSLGTPDKSKLDLPFCRPTTLNVPIYIHFKANFTKSNWSPYASMSIGGRLSETMYKDCGDGFGFFYNQSGFLGDLSFGVDRKVTEKLSLYLGIGYKVESFLYVEMSKSNNTAYAEFVQGNKLLHGFSIHIGLSF